MRLTMPNRSKVLRARRSIRVTLTTSPGRGVEHAEKLAPGGPRTRYLLAVDVPVDASGRAQLLKLGVEGLAVFADAGIAETAVLGLCCGHVFQQM
jgi:hypothetical protein